MLPSYNKNYQSSGGSHRHGHSHSAFVSRLPLLLCLILVLFALYQRQYYLDLLRQEESRNFRLEKEFAVSQESLYSSREEVSSLTNRVDAEQKKAKRSQAELDDCKSSLEQTNVDLDEAVRKRQDAEAMSRNLSSQLDNEKEFSKATIETLTESQQKCTSNLDIATRKFAELENSLQACVDENGKLRTADNQQQVPQNAAFHQNPNSNPIQSQNKKQPGQNAPENLANKEEEESGGHEGNPEIKEGSDVDNGETKLANEKEGKSNELPPNEQAIQVQPPEDDSHQEEGDNEVTEKLEGDNGDKHEDLVETVNNFLKDNQVV